MGATTRDARLWRRVAERSAPSKEGPMRRGDLAQPCHTTADWLAIRRLG